MALLARRGYDPTKPLDEAYVAGLDEGKSTEVTAFLDSEIRFEPRRGEASVLARIEEAAERVVREVFSEADGALDQLYAEVRVPEWEEVGEIRVPRTKDSRVVWQRGPDGEYLQDWSRLDGMDIERAVMTIQRVVGEAGREVARLQNRVEFAYAVSQDEYWDAYRSSLDGTINDRTAKAQRSSRDSRYYYMFNRAVFLILNSRLEYLKGVKRDMEFMRSRLIKETKS